MKIPKCLVSHLAELIFLAGILPPSYALGDQSYTISTFAGSSNNGDGGPDTQAFVSILEGVCADNAGNVYLADANDNRIRMINPAGIISTFAGTGTPGYAGDGGPATQAFLNAPYGIRIDSGGNLFIADLGNNVIRRVATDGTITTVVSNLAAPRNLAFDNSGNMYVAEFGANRVSRVNADGATTLIAGNGTGGFSGDGGPAIAAELNGPAGIVFDIAGSLYIADSANARVRKVTPDGSISTVAGAGAAGGAALLPISEPTGVAADPGGNVYVTNVDAPRTFRMDPDGSLLQLPGDGRDLFFSPAGNLLLAGEQHLETLYPSGELTTVLDQSTYTFGDGGPANLARFESVTAIGIDGQGQVTIADAAFRRIRQVALNGVINALPVSDYLTDPQSLAFNAAGALYIADGGSIIISNGGLEPAGFAANLVNPDGLTFDTAGTLYFSNAKSLYAAIGETAPTVIAGPFGSPAGLTTDSLGDIYVADAGTNRILEVFANGTEAVIAGTGTSGYSGDLGYATAALLAAPAGVYLDSTGVLWIADTGNNVIRTVDTAGVIRTVAGNGAGGFSGDGGPATGALLSSPTAVVEDSSGNIYIADSGNQRVRELTVGTSGSQVPNGTVTVVHSATFKTGAIAGGEIVALFGLAIGPAVAMGAQLDAGGDVATTLGGTTVLFNGVAAPLYYAGANQINAEAPIEIAGSVSALVQVQSGTRTIANGLVDIAPYAPGLFATGAYAAALNQDLTVNGSGNPAPKGSVIVLYGTGFGSTQPLDKTGVPATPPLGIPLGYVTVSINGESAAVLYVGDAPYFCGLTQLNVQIPGDVTGQAQVVVNEGAASSPAGVSIWVQ
jgi:uncharacterized protein (TIGR03437 family)